MEYEEYYDEVYDEDYSLQPVGCTTIFFAVIGVAIGLIFLLSKIEISVPLTQAQTENFNSIGGREGKIASLFTPEVQYWSANIVAWSEQTGLDPNLIATVMQIESCGDPQARSSAGAMGLFQVMPYHFENGEDPYKPAINARRGLDYLQRALEARNGEIRYGFAGYNGGITGAKRPESQWANETQRYVYWGTGIYEDALKGYAQSDRLNEWLGRGGTSLCNQASQRLGLR